MSEIDVTKLSEIELKALGWDQARIRDEATRALNIIQQELATRQYSSLNAKPENEQNPDGGVGDDKGSSD